uniref:Uncharacterized protein n=1 Tax=Myoviridae sp. ctsIb3 TaxID=2825189 RepID=A0A8S5URB6_9CAUD|nr:MAG TPA: hypothetical protein [Myoviridae sp. ctsIb3]
MRFRSHAFPSFQLSEKLPDAIIAHLQHCLHYKIKQNYAVNIIQCDNLHML